MGDPKLNLQTGDYRQREKFLLEVHALHRQVFNTNNELTENVKKLEESFDEKDPKLVDMKGRQKKANSVRSGLMRLARELQGGGVRQGSFFPPTETHQDRLAQFKETWDSVKEK